MSWPLLAVVASKFGRRVGTVLGVGMLLASMAAAQTTPSAYVYVQTSSGVIAYKAASNGALTKIAGSPFKTTGLLAGSTGVAFYSVGTHYIHAYKVASNGVIGSQISQINTQLYPGADCGPSTPGEPGVLDHTGKYFYNFLSTFGTCSVYQTFNIASNGALSFNNYTRIDTANSGPNATSTAEIQAILGNETFAYTVENSGHLSGIVGFKREASGALQYMPINVIDDPSGEYSQGPLAADPTNHIAAVAYPHASFPPQLLSYTADSNGNLTSANTQSNAPFTNLEPSQIAMAPSGLLLAVAGDSCCGVVPNDGLQIFHFNGAKPLTKYKVLLTGIPVDFVKWDRSNHLYAVSYSAQKIYVYTVTSVSISAVPGSPYAIGSTPTALFVRSLH